MNFKSKIKLILNVVVKSKFKDFKELFSLLKFLLLGGKIFIIFSARIGHQLLNPLAFLSKITPEESSKYKFAISNPKRLSSNIFITNFWTKYLTQKGYLVFSGDLSNLLIEIFIKSRNSGDAFVGHDLKGTRDFYLSTKRSINKLYHNRNDCGEIMNKEYKPLSKLQLKISTPINGVPLKPLKYVCTYTRDSEYLSSFGFGKDFSYHDYRNDDYLKLIPTVNYLNSKEITVLRMGNVKKKLDSKYFSKKHIDFIDFSIDGSDDIRICANCLFFICDTSGIALIPLFFGRPVVRYNWIPIFNSVPYNSIVIPMLIKDIKTDQILSFRKVWELKEKGLNLSNGHSYEKFGLKCIKNSHSDIQDVSIEMMKRVMDNNFESSHPKQKEFEEMMASIGWPKPGIIGYSFMEKYSHLF